MPLVGCLATTTCRVIEPSRREPSTVRIHLAIDTKHLGAELMGSWWQAALLAGIIDCSSGESLNPSAKKCRSSGCNRPVVAMRPYDPLGNASSSTTTEAEMFFMMLTGDFILADPGRPANAKRDPLTFQYAEADERVKSSCGETLTQLLSHRTEVKWPQQPAAAAPPRITTLGHALRAASPNSAIVFSSSFTPDIGSMTVLQASRWLNARGVDAASRGLTLHYRHGRLGEGWARKLTRARLLAHGRTSLVVQPPANTGDSAARRGGSVMMREAWWHSYWSMILDSTVSAKERALCVEAKRHGTDVDVGVCNGKQRLADWCHRPSPPLSQLMMRSPREAQMLLLGGDAHYGREYASPTGLSPSAVSLPPASHHHP